MIIGLTGGSGSGKSTIANKLGGKVISSDPIYHQLLLINKSLQDELIKRFGTCERSKLREKVFGDSNKKALQDLEKITHKYIVDEILKLIHLYQKEKLVIIDAAIVMIKTSLAEACDKVIAILADRAVRVYRITARDNISREAAEARIDSQPKDEVYLEKSDAAVYNNDDINKALQQIKNIIKEK